MEPCHSSSSAGSSHAYGSLQRNLSPLGLTKEQWEDLARPLGESQQASVSQEEFVPSTNLQETQPSSEIPSSQPVLQPQEILIKVNLMFGNILIK